jgi:uncharacterized membrane protein YdbT with pleckstrin-like domain
MNEEKTIWRGSSSAVLYAGFYFLCGSAFILCLAAAIYLGIHYGLTSALVCVGVSLLPLIAGLVRWLVNQSCVYELTSQRIRISSGIFSKTSQEVELYRIKDMTMVQPFLQRFFKCGNLVLATNDASTPTVAIEAVPEIEKLRDELRNAVETCRDQKRVRLNELE